MVDLNVVLVSGVQQSDSVIHMYLFQILFPYRLLQNIEYSRALFVGTSFFKRGKKKKPYAAQNLKL